MQILGSRENKSEHPSHHSRFVSMRYGSSFLLYNWCCKTVLKEKRAHPYAVEMYKNEPNPWEEISLSDYENHMSLDSVKQLQTMNSLMKRQFEAYPVESVIILGIAGGNGLEHVRKEKYRKVYGVDINARYLCAVSERYMTLSGILECIQLDLLKDVKRLPDAQFVIANLLIEYIGYSAFGKVVRQINPEYVSCVIQINTDENNWVSDSPYIHSFDGLDAIHHQMEEEDLTAIMNEEGYHMILKETCDLPNGKALVRMDNEKKERISVSR